jgi:hypothetical protein
MLACGRTQREPRRHYFNQKSEARAAHEYLSHGNSSHGHRRSQSAATIHLMGIDAHRAPLQFISWASTLTERRYNSSHDALGAGVEAGAGVGLAVAGALAGAVELGGALSFLAVPLSDFASA